MRKNIAPIGALLLLSFFWSLGSLRSDLLPNLFPVSHQLPGFQSQAIALGLFALAAAVLSLRHGTLPTKSAILSAAAFGLGLFLVPGFLIKLSHTQISDFARVALFSLVPVFAVVLDPHLGRCSTQPANSALMAALLSVVGTLFVFPVDLPSSIGQGIAFLALVVAVICIAAVNCWMVRVATEFPARPIWTLAAIAAVTAALGFAAASAFSEHPVWSPRIVATSLGWSALVDLPALILLFWLMRRMSAPRMTVRYVLAPLLANLIGLVLLRPAVNLRAAGGLILIATGAGWLLLAQNREASSANSTLNLDGD